MDKRHYLEPGPPCTACGHAREHHLVLATAGWDPAKPDSIVYLDLPSCHACFDGIDAEHDNWTHEYVGETVGTTRVTTGVVRKYLSKGWDGDDYVADAFLAGERVYVYEGPTYGCIGRGIAVTRVPGETPFLEIPVRAVAWDG